MCLRLYTTSPNAQIIFGFCNMSAFVIAERYRLRFIKPNAALLLTVFLCTHRLSIVHAV